MIPLPTNQRLLRWVCFLPMDPDEVWWQKGLYILFSTIWMATDVLRMIASIVFFINNISIDLEEALYALFQISASTGCTFMCIVAFIRRDQIAAFLETLSAIYEAHANDLTLRFLVRANDLCEQNLRYYFIATGGFVISAVGNAVTSVFICQWLGLGFDLKYLYRLYRISLPWNQATAVGYAAMMAFSIMYGLCYLFFNGATMMLFIAICVHHREFSHRLAHSVQKLDQQGQERHAKKNLTELINFYISAKEWFKETAEFYSQFILVQLICSMVFLACCMFQMDLQLKHPNFSIVLLLVGLAVSMANLYLYCYFGKVTTDSYAEMTKSVFESNWFEHPNHLQKYFILMMANMQRPVFYDGFGIILLNLETFTLLLRNCVTYYMLFKTITAN